MTYGYTLPRYPPIASTLSPFSRPALRRLLVGDVGDQPGPHFLAVDDVRVPSPRPPPHSLFTVPLHSDGAGAQRGEVGARLRLGVPDGEMDLTRGYPGEVARLLLRGAVAHDRRADGVDGQEGHRHPGDRRLVGEDELVEHGAATPAVFRGPAQGQPAVAAELPDHLAVGLAVPVVAVG